MEIAADGAGVPLFVLSPLSIHCRNLLQDPKCSLVMEIPGWMGLANAHNTMFGEVRGVGAWARSGRVGSGWV